jgi:hypothetical protein
MKKLKFTVIINAPKEEVWKVLWSDSTYGQWTSVFSEDSKAITDWKEDSKVLFLAGNGEGMFSTIAKNIPNKFMSFEHLGVVKDGKEQPLDEETKKWSGAMENYSLEETEGATTLTVDVDATEEYHDFFMDKFPKALGSVKVLAESKRTEKYAGH